MNKKTIYCFLVMMGGMLCSSCEKDHEPDNSGNGSATVLPIPASVVDGVRLSDMGDMCSVKYNPDGSISSAELNGKKLGFEYTSRAAETTGAMLQRIVILNSVWEEYDEYYACDFSFNTDGYVAKWTEHIVYDYGDEYYACDFTFTTDYNADGRIERLNISGKYYDPESGKETEGQSGHVDYKYMGGKLISSTVQIPDEGKSEFKLGYDLAPENTYNISPYPLFEVMGHGALSEVADVLAVLGYLGKPSSYLPTSRSYEGDDYEDVDMKISYKTNDRNRVTSISYIYGGMSGTLDLKYFIHK